MAKKKALQNPFKDLMDKKFEPINNLKREITVLPEQEVEYQTVSEVVWGEIIKSGDKEVMVTYNDNKRVPIDTET